jgi:hypothetical protein
LPFTAVNLSDPLSPLPSLSPDAKPQHPSISTASPPSPPSPPVTAPLAGYPRKAVPPFSFVGRRWGVPRKRSPWIPYGEEEEGSNPHPFPLILWCAQALKIFIVLLLDPNQGNQWPYPNPNPKFLDLHAVRVLNLEICRMLPICPIPECLSCK